MPTELSKLKIIIGYPSPERTDYRFNKCLLELLVNNWTSIPLFLTNSVGSRITQNRNTIIEEARKVGATHILFVDADMTFPINALVRLLNHDKPIVGATTSRRMGDDRAPAAYPVDVKSIVNMQQLVPMKLLGPCFMLVKMEVFDKLQRPYFAEPPRRMMSGPNAEAIRTEDQDLVPEDEYFCITAREAGFEILCDMQLSMEMGHVGTTVYYIKNPFPVGTTGDITFEPNVDLDFSKVDDEVILKKANDNLTDEQVSRSQGGTGE